MIPILFESNETEFLSNGLGRLRDISNCVVFEERNGAFECDFSYPTTGELYDEIRLGRIIGVIHDDSRVMQPFDIVSYERGIDGFVDFHAVHISYRLSKHTCAIKNVNSLSTALDYLKRLAKPENPFYFVTDMSSSAYFAAADGIPRTVREMIGGVEGSILDTYGGELKWNNFTVNLLHARGIERDLTIRYGVDMVGYNEDTDCSETYSSVIPYWAGNEQIVVGNKVTSQSSTITGRDECVPLDLSDKFENAPTIAQLTAEATAQLRQGNPTLPTQTITVDFVRLSDSPEYEQYKGLYECQLCDTIKVVFPKYDMSGRFKIVKTTYDVLLERYTELELGTLSTSLSEALGVSNGLGGGQLSENLADYVVAQGTDGIWTYRKWNSGIAECWGRGSATLSNYATVNGFYGYNTSFSLPSGLFVSGSVPTHTYTASVGTAFAIPATGISTSNTSIHVYALTNVSGSQSCVFDMVVKGRWK